MFHHPYVYHYQYEYLTPQLFCQCGVLNLRTVLYPHILLGLPGTILTIYPPPHPSPLYNYSSPPLPFRICPPPVVNTLTPASSLLPPPMNRVDITL